MLIYDRNLHDLSIRVLNPPSEQMSLGGGSMHVYHDGRGRVWVKISTDQYPFTNLLLLGENFLCRTGDYLHRIVNSPHYSHR
jgi:hypothetical protein